MVNVSTKKRVTQVEQLAQAPARQVILQLHLRAHNALQAQQVIQTAQLAVQRLAIKVLHLVQVLVRQVLRLYQADTATPEHHLIPTAQLVAQKPVIPVCKQ